MYSEKQPQSNPADSRTTATTKTDSHSTQHLSTPSPSPDPQTQGDSSSDNEEAPKYGFFYTPPPPTPTRAEFFPKTLGSPSRSQPGVAPARDPYAKDALLRQYIRKLQEAAKKDGA